jgi:hypothetical protein
MESGTSRSPRPTRSDITLPEDPELTYSGRHTIGGMRMPHSRKFVAMLACCGATMAVLVGHASAGQIFQETFHEEGSNELQNFCGVAGLNVHETFSTDVRVGAVSQGPDELPHFREHDRQSVVWTNLANGEAVSSVLTTNGRDLKVTDNGDGTLTVLVQLTGNTTLYADGKAIGKDSGQVRFEILIDHGGTPTDPSDDEFITDLGVVKEPTGRNDDFCPTVVPALA